MKTSITSGITEGQEKSYKRLVEDAASKGANLALQQVPLDKDGFQKLVIENGDELNLAIVSFIVAKTKEFSLNNQFTDEEVKSKYGYLSGYKKSKGITEQTNILRQLFPGVGFADEKLAEQPHPSNTEGWFAIPKWQTMAKTYGEAVQMVLDKIKEARNGKFCNYRNGKLGPQHLRQSVKSAAIFQKLADEQKDHDILVVAGQFGIFHRGRSVRRALEVMPKSESGLGVFANGIMLLTHPERLMDYDDLWIDCAGDEYSYGGVERFDYAPYFFFYDGRVRFDASGVGYARGYYGSSSVFVSQ